jgi:hypothetical protein
MLQVSQAELYWRGFSELKSRAPGHPTTPDFDVVAEYPPWRTTLEGWCTRYGDVTELLAARDERLVLINGGDAIRLRFEAGNLPELPAGWQRSVFFYSVGWDKDGDNNVVDGDRVAPLPVKITSSTEGSEDWRVRYNTRWVPGDRFVR